MDTSNTSYEDIVRAVRDKAVEFDAALTKVKETNDQLVERAERALAAITELVGSVRGAPGLQAKKCVVCFTRDVDMVLVPCGHTFCSSCARRGLRTRCHTCRADVSSSMRIYI